MTYDFDLRPENQVNPANVTVGWYTLAAHESAGQVPSSGDLELEMAVYMDGTIELDNNMDPDKGDWRHIRLTPSQVTQLRILINDPTAVRPYRPPA